jgi:hypothetical protein
VDHRSDKCNVTWCWEADGSHAWWFDVRALVRLAIYPGRRFRLDHPRMSWKGRRWPRRVYNPRESGTHARCAAQSLAHPRESHIFLGTGFLPFYRNHMLAIDTDPQRVAGPLFWAISHHIAGWLGSRYSYVSLDGRFNTRCPWDRLHDINFSFRNRYPSSYRLLWELSGGSLDFQVTGEHAITWACLKFNEVGIHLYQGPCCMVSP